MNGEVLKIIGKREMFWDNYLIDEDKTTAFHRVFQPVKKEYCFYFDKGEEIERGISYPCIVKDKTGYKMY